MAEIYEDDISLFGPVNITTYDHTIYDELNADEVKHIRALNKVEHEQITKGRNRIVEKVKEIRQSFSRAVTSGTRSGSGKIVYEFYDRLIGIWGGSANTGPLSFGVSGGDINIINNKENEDDEDSGRVIAVRRNK